MPRSDAIDATDGAPGDAPDLFARVQEVLDLIRPAVQLDGGDVELVEVTEGGVVRVRLHGACVGCPSSTLTLQAGIESRLRERIDEVSRVEPVN
jgi:Fe-S cluster biogenesis protein NfuA